MNSSEWQTPAAVTYSRTWPGPGVGIGMSTTSGALPMVVYWSAFMMSSQSAGGEMS